MTHTTGTEAETMPVDLIYNEIIDKLQDSHNNLVVDELERVGSSAATSSEALLSIGAY